MLIRSCLLFVRVLPYLTSVQVSSWQKGSASYVLTGGLFRFGKITFIPLSALPFLFCGLPLPEPWLRLPDLFLQVFQMAKGIAVANQRDGCSKISVVANLGIGLAMERKKVAVIGADPQ